MSKLYYTAHKQFFNKILFIAMIAILVTTMAYACEVTMEVQMSQVEDACFEMLPHAHPPILRETLDAIWLPVLYIDVDAENRIKETPKGIWVSKFCPLIKSFYSLSNLSRECKSTVRLISRNAETLPENCQ